MKPKTLFWVTIFAVSMGFFESAIVIYLREIVYPNGFAFPLQPIERMLATTEILREAFSLLMLLSVGILAGKSTVTRFAYFLYAFAVWDICYYIFLKILINWPESFMTMDILFLLPVIWVGPVVAPLILSFLMILLALLILHFSTHNQQVHLKVHELVMLIAGSVIVIISFTQDYLRFIFSHYSIADIWAVPAKDFFEFSVQYYPGNFYWPIFIGGVIFILIGIGLFTKRNILLTKDTLQ
ncbi:MAG: hypothetical protein H0S84_10005 [Bacteroidales bacterium]|jgi:hypothetical protein|nr:hypothetical protein [Bacteroidales bacterium]